MEAPALMKYGEVVRDLAARGGNWCYYDTQFCFIRSTHINEMPRGSTHWELWIPAQNFGVANKPKHQTVNQPSVFVPKGFLGNLTWVEFAQEAVISIVVSSVGFCTQHIPVHFVPQILETWVPLAIFVPLMQTLTQQLGPKPPTLVALSACCLYDACCFLFPFGFCLQFSGQRVSFFAKNLLTQTL